MTNKQLGILARRLLDRAQIELNMCNENKSEHARDTWIACMAASRTLSALAAALIDLKMETQNEQEKTQTTS